MRKLWILRAGLLLAATFAASTALGDAPQWKVDTAKSKLGFTGEQTRRKFEGHFARYVADITFDPDRPETSRIIVTIDLASASSGDTQRDTAMPGKDWFDVAQFPQAKFETTAIRKVGAAQYEATGNLTIRGITKPVSLPFTLESDGTTARAKGRVSLVRTAFGVGQGAWASAQWVALEVGVDVDVVASRRN